jgi:predicted glycogen debranching enzyme
VYVRPGSAGHARLVKTEWLLTNGLGGFAMGTAAGVPTRRYHGLLVAATTPPVGRMVCLSSIVERLDVGEDNGRSVDLSTFQFKGSPPVIHPRGVDTLVGFEKDLEARWVYSALGLVVTKTVTLVHGASAVTVAYTMVRSGASRTSEPARLTLRPLAAMRDFHGLVRRWNSDRFTSAAIPGGVRVGLDGREMDVVCTNARFVRDQQWWYDFFYAIEAERGQDCLEDLYSPGEFVLDLPATRAEAACVLTASLGPAPDVTAEASVRARSERLAKMAAAATPPGAGEGDRRALAALVAAADDFVVARGTGAGTPGGVSIIAGYPWFSDWGRDTFISLPGLLLETGRLDEARRTLLAFAGRRRRGIIPNLFSDTTGEPEYNTVDASLWFIQAALRYAERSGDAETWRTSLKPACLDIVEHYRRGTDFNIAMDPLDKLVSAGTSATQLTWMDAKRDGVVFTPRHGKCVEINALWHSGLKGLAAILAGDDATLAANLSDLADAVGRSFRAGFWNQREACLYDRLAPSDGGQAGVGAFVPIAELRPNQIFAVSLPHSPLTMEQQRSVLAAVKQHLLTPEGLRTLAPGGGGYRGRYEGTLFERDRAYHNGTAWPWLLGAYAEGVLRAGNFLPHARAEARGVFDRLLAPLTSAEAFGAGEGACLGQIAEIFDGDPPQRPQGCTAQAWSVAEALRVVALCLREQASPRGR